MRLRNVPKFSNAANVTYTEPLQFAHLYFFIFPIMAVDYVLTAMVGATLMYSACNAYELFGMK